MQELVSRVVQWADDRNLILGSSPERQVYKTMEEATELAVAIGRYNNGVLSEHLPEMQDAIGDVTVT